MGDSNTQDHTKENLRIGRENRLVAERLARSNARPQQRVSAEEREAFVMPKHTARIDAPAFVVLVNPADAKRVEEQARQTMITAHGVRDLSKESDVKACDKVIPGRKGKTPKPAKEPRAPKPIPVDPRMAHVRSLGATTMISGGEGSKEVRSLPGIKQETIVARSEAMKTASSSNQVALRFEGIRVQTLGEKNNGRVADPMVPTWFLYRDGVEINLPHTWPTRSYIIGVDVLRVQAAHVGKLIRENVIDRAVLAMPCTEGETFGKQWAHVPARTELVSVDSSGRMVPTREIAGVEAKETKPDGANYQVCYILPTKAGVESLEAWCHSEAQAYTTALGLMGNGAVRVTIIGTGKQLSPERYPLTMGKTMTGRSLECWRFDGVSASITRQGFALLQKGSISTDAEIEKERRQAMLPNIWTKKHPQHNGPWMRSAKTDKATFSHG